MEFFLFAEDVNRCVRLVVSGKYFFFFLFFDYLLTCCCTFAILHIHSFIRGLFLSLSRARSVRCSTKEKQSSTEMQIAIFKDHDIVRRWMQPATVNQFNLFHGYLLCSSEMQAMNELNSFFYSEENYLQLNFM